MFSFANVICEAILFWFVFSGTKILWWGSLNYELKDLRNCILCLISVWSLFCSVRVYISLHFLPMILVKLDFRLSVFWFFVFLYLWVLIFSFALCFEFNVFSKLNIVLSGNIIINHVLFNFVLTLFNRSVKI